MRRSLRVLGAAMCVALLLPAPFAAPAADAADYHAYRDQYAGMPFTGETLTLAGDACTDAREVEAAAEYEGRAGVALTGGAGQATWRFRVETAGMYAVGLTYRPMEGTGNAIQRRVTVDGALPASELAVVEFGRVYRDGGPVASDARGNDIRPDQVEVPDWTDAYIRDNTGYYGDRLYLYLEAGERAVTLESLQEPMAIAEVRLESVKPASVPYDDYVHEKQAQGAADASGVLADGLLEWQAEQALYKSSPSLYAMNDMSSHKTTPSDTAAQKLNVIGGGKWEEIGQWISWEVDVPASGFYVLGFRFKQDYGKQSVRRLTIDGALPFEEAAALSFGYAGGWQRTLAGGDAPYKLYLEAGRRVIALEVALGGDSESIYRAGQVLADLNDANWQLMTVLGNSPDTNRDYQLERNLPEVVRTLDESAAALREIAAVWEAGAGERDNSVAETVQLAAQLQTMADSPRKIPGMYLFFRDLLASFSNLVVDVRLQPLLLDTLYLLEPGTPAPREKAEPLAALSYGVRRFLSSFWQDYSLVSEDGGDGRVITAWLGNGMTGGRDQAQSLNQLIMQDFSPRSGIAVRLQLVPAGTVLTASLAGKGPDVSLFSAVSDPVNYAMRGAAEDLSGYAGFDETAAQFHEEAFTAYRYDGGVYALPETMQFMMMFYRKDILGELGIDAQSLKTWEDVRNALPVLQAANMNFGLPALLAVNLSAAPNTYFMFLYQNGGSIYADGGRASALGERTALDAFHAYTRFYTSYGLPFIYNFETRFRTGEIPIGIADYTTYNLLQISAPEIRGLWGMAPVPGTARGEAVDNTVPVTGTGSILMKAAKDKDACWQFLRWWVGEDTQYAFGRDLESVLGVGARYNTANLGALQRLPWLAEERAALNAQMASLRGVPEVPGGYITTRSVDFAVKAVYNTGEDARNKLLSYLPAIDRELRDKRREFKLD